MKATWIAVVIWVGACGEADTNFERLQSDAGTEKGDLVSAAGECGGLRGLGCGEGQYCVYETEQACGAGDQLGRCEAIPHSLSCARSLAPVCGCDGVTYNNDCEARRAGISVLSRGACQPHSQPVGQELRVADFGVGVEINSVKNIEIQGDTLNVSFTYGGGCLDHRFDMIWDGAFLESNPVQVELRLVDHVRGDVCESILFETLAFDLSTLKQAYSSSYQTQSAMVLIQIAGKTVEYRF